MSQFLLGPIPWLITMAIVLVFLVIVWTMPKERKEISTSKMMSTKEGREELARMIRAKYGRDSKVSVDPCPTCEGYGREFHQTKRDEKGVLRVFTWGNHCRDCGGVGIRGGLDYVVVDCPECGGMGVKDEVGCRVCLGTKVVRREKDETKLVGEKESMEGKGGEA